MDCGLLWSVTWNTEHAVEPNFHELHRASDDRVCFAYETNFNTVRRGTPEEAHRVHINDHWSVTFIGQLHKFRMVLRARPYSAFLCLVLWGSPSGILSAEAHQQRTRLGESMPRVALRVSTTNCASRTMRE